MKFSVDNPFLRLNQEYLYQQGIEEFTKKNLKDYGLDKNCFKLIGETNMFWITRYTDGTDVIDIVYKNTGLRMDCFEL